jgi:hypothetical protein
MYLFQWYIDYLIENLGVRFLIIQKNIYCSINETTFLKHYLLIVSHHTYYVF